MQHMAPTVRWPTSRRFALRPKFARIREVLKPAVSDLATTFGVSRQSVYNWLNGEPVADENAAKLQGLAQAASVLAHEGRDDERGPVEAKVRQWSDPDAGGTSREVGTGCSTTTGAHSQAETAQRERMAARFANRADCTQC